MHGEDAFYVAETVFETTTVIKYYGTSESSGLAYVTLTRLAAESLIRDLLLEKQHCVEVWSTQAGSRRDWSLTRRGSPGQLQDFQDWIEDAVDGGSAVVPVLAALSLQSQDQQPVCPSM